jgi:hypothetical protein
MVSFVSLQGISEPVLRKLYNHNGKDGIQMIYCNFSNGHLYIYLHTAQANTRSSLQLTRGTLVINRLLSVAHTPGNAGFLSKTLQ